MSRLFILGAGFSRPAGLPLGRDLFAEVVAEARQLGIYDGKVMEADLERYARYVGETEGRKITVESLDLEEFMSFLDIEHTLRFKGNDTWTTAGNKTQLIIRYLIGRVLFLKQLRMPHAAVELYDQFAATLNAGDRIITFNYDTLIETACDRLGKRYRLVPSRFSHVSENGATSADGSGEEITLLKMHGSIDWFDRRGFDTSRRDRRRHGIKPPPHDAVFNNRRMRREPLVKGPYWKTSLLRQIWRVRNLGTYFDYAAPGLDAPLIISPSYNKLLYLNPIAEFWDGIQSMGTYPTTVAVVGYSLPSYDAYVRQALYHIVGNFQCQDPDDLIAKTNIRLVDYRLDNKAKQEYFEAYRFVDWGRADVRFTGFDVNAISMLCAA